MSRKYAYLRLALIGGCLVAIGCEKAQQAAPIPSPTATTSTSILPLVAHPEYTHWSQFPVGSYVIRHKEVTNKNGTVYVTTRVKLNELTSDRVVVEQQVTVVRPDVTQENEPQLLSYPAQFRLPETVQIEQFSLPSLKAKLAGQESIVIAGQEILADVFEWQEVNEAGPMQVKLWWSSSVPGKLLKEATLIERDGDTSSEEVTEIVIAKVADN
ncbi:MAG: hypothetical protein KDB22_23270 [Planctomycetales bacterium]|nr:hypothetical protein [Planctomycetales bacterium]